MNSSKLICITWKCYQKAAAQQLLSIYEKHFNSAVIGLANYASQELSSVQLEPCFHHGFCEGANMIKTLVLYWAELLMPAMGNYIPQSITRWVFPLLPPLSFEDLEWFSMFLCAYRQQLQWEVRRVQLGHHSLGGDHSQEAFWWDRRSGISHYVGRA